VAKVIDFVCYIQHLLHVHVLVVEYQGYGIYVQDNDGNEVVPNCQDWLSDAEDVYDFALS
jgi:esterase/lipase